MELTWKLVVVCLFCKMAVINFMCFVFFFQRAELTSDKDLYLDNSSIEEASGVYPIDDDDYTSGSGSGKFINEFSGGSYDVCFYSPGQWTCVKYVP